MLGRVSWILFGRVSWIRRHLFSGNFQTETQPLIDLEDFDLRNPHKNQNSIKIMGTVSKNTFLKWRRVFFCHFLMRSSGISKDCWHVLLRDAAWHGAALIESMASKFLPPKIFGILTGMGWTSFGFETSNGIFRKSQRIIFFHAPIIGKWEVIPDPRSKGFDTSPMGGKDRKSVV